MSTNSGMGQGQAERLSKKQITLVIGIIGGILLFAGILFMILYNSLSNRSPGADAPLEAITQYRYEYAEAANGMKLHALVTKPAFVTLEVVRENVTLTNKVGINGGFFYGDTLISMGIVNGRTVNGAANAYGSGGENMKYARGTLVWDGASDSLSVQVVSTANEVKVKDHTRFWAQGGISMSLGDEAGWVNQTVAENAPFPDEQRLRSAAVYDESGMLYLIVSETGGSLHDFRTAIMDTIGDGGLVDGIFLDGDGSSQLLSKEMKLAGDNRPVLQMLRITK
ncbi:phosphodiester glycosidase family protein [Paenibacillus sp. 1011MAR3C5]|uniref:phosphodiester glycosidase family protein n=1 Tax=Paenibacillus sp. 1011MAR3C5 TaxID=1675787 RepID=UPI002175D76A|nr:phosphodiester glycosidase family protein [Paenibacillus sp. 1011MAR3C5]